MAEIAGKLGEVNIEDSLHAFEFKHNDVLDQQINDHRSNRLVEVSQLHGNLLLHAETKLLELHDQGSLKHTLKANQSKVRMNRHRGANNFAGDSVPLRMGLRKIEFRCFSPVHALLRDLCEILGHLCASRLLILKILPVLRLGVLIEFILRPPLGFLQPRQPALVFAGFLRCTGRV